MMTAINEVSQDLGRLQAVHRISRVKLFLGMLFGLGSISFSVILFVSWFGLDPRQDNPWLIFAVGLICLSVGVLFLWGLSRLGREELRFYEKGLTYKNRTANHIVLWERVGSVFEFVFRTSVNGIPSPRSFTYSILTKDNEPLVFRSHLTGIKQIGERLKAEAEKRDMPVNKGIATDYLNTMPSLFPK